MSHVFGRSVLPWVAVAILSSACGCIMGSSDAQTQKDAPKPTPAPAPAAAAAPAEEGRVRADWQKRMLTLLESEGAGYADAWGLFSEGGWSDAGQVLVLATKDRSLVKVFALGPGKKTFDVDRSLTKAEFKKIDEVTKDSTKLEDIDIDMMDGIIFEFVHATREGGGKPVVKDRLYVKNPGAKPMPEHEKLINAFQELRKPSK